MIVKIHLFAAAREIVGQEVVDLIIPDNSNVGQLKLSLAQQYPKMKNLISKSSISVQRQYASDDSELFDGAEVGIIPPVSGG